MEETYLLSYPGVKKKILAGGKGPLPHFPPGTKVIFHFQTLLDNFERTVVDDSRLAGRPAEIFVGKMFKMEIWESLLTSMRVGEVAEFWCDAVHTGLYPIVSKGMRLIAQGKDPLEGQKHMCGMGNLFHYHSTGFPELDEIMRNPQPLIFIMELLQVSYRVLLDDLKIISPTAGSSSHKKLLYASNFDFKEAYIEVDWQMNHHKRGRLLLSHCTPRDA
uniref:Aryl-hydrocarbon-interacting protein-like 1 n=1 Tax=Poecilia latipinna TaxID=48699 RepID=A0A3B3UHP0_9TELE